MLQYLLLLTSAQLLWALDREQFGCGMLGDACCTQDDVDAVLATVDNPDDYNYDYYLEDGPFCFDDYKYVCYNNKCVTTKVLPCGQLGEDCCNEADFPNLPFTNCISSDLYCSGGKCLTSGQLPCGGDGEACCKEGDFSGGYGFDDCFNGLYCVEGKCQGEYALPCGQDGERCCAPNEIPDNSDYPYYYSDDFCFSPSVCMAGECITCNKPGDPCCFNSQSGKSTCEGPNICVNDKCVGCGQVGMACCADGVEDYGNSNPCYEGLDCLNGKCQYCGYQNSACCGTGADASCKLNDLTCNSSSNKCELCGNMGEACCGNSKCSQDFLECIKGTCTCGSKGQKCCAGMCEGKLKCNKKTGRCDKASKPKNG